MLNKQRLIFSVLLIFTINFSIFSQTSIEKNGGKSLSTIENWFNLDPAADNINGISTEKAYELLKGKKSSTVVLAIIDSGVEIDHPELTGKIWVNEKEIPNNGIDDDRNGYIDDINGWDFLGNAKGKDLTFETLELTREMLKYKALIEPIDALNATKEQKALLEKYRNLKEKYDTKADELDKQGGKFFIQLYENFQNAKQALLDELKITEVTKEVLDKINSESSENLQKAKKMYAILKEVDLDEEKLEDGYDYFNAQINYGLNEDYNGRNEFVGDNVNDLNEKGYGNNEVEGPDAHHGTHVAGIIAANRNDGNAVSGVAENVKIMTLRAVPNGDERDKDVANAIRYAVDNGAKLINMSFGKAYSPEKEIVDQAVKYADQKGVLIIHAAGNDNLNVDIEDNFPSKYFKNENKTAQNWIEVGALSWKKGLDAVATFSNYGKKSVDIFAPGVDLYSLNINGKYKELSGTSMAAPVVTGMAALLWSYFPNLSAVELKNVILESCLKLENNDVYIPGSQTDIKKFNALSVTGGIANAANAVKLAQKISK